LRRPAGARGQRHADDAANEGHSRDLVQHHRPNLRRVRAERHAQTDLARPLRHAVGKHAVESDRGQERRQSRKHRRERADQTVLEHIRTHLLFHRHQVGYGQGRVDSGNQRTDRAMTLSIDPDVAT
jgi:hypothetical protein